MIYREERNLLEYIYVYIKKNFQSPKNRIFPKGLTHTFNQKMPIAPMHDYVRRVNFTNKPRL